MLAKITLEAKPADLETLLNLIERRCEPLRKLAEGDSAKRAQLETLEALRSQIDSQLREADPFGYGEKKIQQETRNIPTQDPYIRRMEEKGE